MQKYNKNESAFRYSNDSRKQSFSRYDYASSAAPSEELEKGDPGYYGNDRGGIYSNSSITDFKNKFQSPNSNFFIDNNDYHILPAEIDVTIVDGYYCFDGVSSENSKFKVSKGTYIFKNVPESHPISFSSRGKLLNFGALNYGGSRKNKKGIRADFYYGNVIVNIEADFKVVDFECLYHGYMGGEGGLVFDVYDASPVPYRKFRVVPDYSLYTENKLTDFHKKQLEAVCKKYSKIILAEQDTVFTLYVKNFTEVSSGKGGTLAYAGPNSLTYFLKDGKYLAKGTSGRTAVDAEDLDILSSRVKAKTALYWTLLHEVGHALGVGTLWNYNVNTSTTVNDYVKLSIDNGGQYVGKNALREYNRIVGKNLASLPIQTFETFSQPSSAYKNKSISRTYTTVLTQEDLDRGYIIHDDPWRPEKFNAYVGGLDGFSVGQTAQYTVYLTWGGHMAELEQDGAELGYRLLDSELQPLQKDELMTPFSPVYDVTPLSRITLGFINDLGFAVSYHQVENK